MPETPRNRTLAAKFDQMPPDIAREVEVFGIELDRFRSGDIPENVFTEFRLRHGVYGQRQDGVQMIRIKIPGGRLTAEQLETLADLSEEYADGISHITTRQDVQYHFVKIADTPMLLKRLAAVGMTTREACGNVIRNVTGCPKAGVCPNECFDVSPYAKALAYYCLRHPELQNFPRKFKIAFSGCQQDECGLTTIHDIGWIATTREKDGSTERGFQMVVGGGLGAVPHQAKVFDEFVPEEEMLPLTVAIGRVFTQRGERKLRMKARLKFLVEKVGLDEFRRLVLAEREKLEYDPGWTSYLDHLDETDEAPLKPPSSLNGDRRPDGFNEWFRTNVIPQRQPGYAFVYVTLPLGDVTADQLRALAAISQKYVRDTIRTTVSQNLILRWVSEADLMPLYEDLKAIALAEPGAERLADITACPGNDSCKLGISSSRGLAAELRERLTDEKYRDVEGLHIKISGCPNSCGQHHIGNIGFFGSSKRHGTHVVPNFQVVLGGTVEENARSYGLAVGKVPAKNAPALVERLLDLYRAEHQHGEKFTDFIQRLGKARIKEVLTEFDQVPDFDEDPAFYRDWRETQEFQLMTGTGECAGMLVELVEFILTEADRLLYEASLHYEKGNYTETGQFALRAMVRAADALLTTEGLQPQKPETAMREFRNRFVEAGRFFSATAEYIEKWAARDLTELDDERAHFVIEEATLFVEEAHVVYGRMQIQGEPTKARPVREVAVEAPPVEEIVDSLDLKGVECPFNYVRTKLRLEDMDPGQLLEITIDDGEPMRNVPASLRNDGHEIVDTKKIGAHYRLLIRKGA